MRWLLLGRSLSRLVASALPNLTFLVLLAAGVAVRIFTILAYRPALLLQRDTLIYLHTAVASDPSPNRFRPALYPLFFLKPLLVFNELVVVVIIQHVVGLATAVVLYLFLRRKGANGIVSGLALAPLLLDGYQVNIEHYVLTEALFDALVVGAFLLLAWRESPPPLIACAVAGALLSAAGLTRFIGLALILPALVYVVWRRVGWFRPALLAAGFAVPLIAYSLWFQGTEGTTGVTNKNGFFLYGRVSSFSECEGLELPRPLQRYCLKEPPEDRPPIIGFWALETLNARAIKDPDTNRQLMGFSKRVILNQPLAYAHAVTDDFLRNFAAGPPISKESGAAKWRFPGRLTDARPHPRVVKLGGSAPPQMGFDDFEIRRPFADRLRSYQDVVYTRGPLLALLLLLGLAGVVLGSRRGAETNLRAESFLFTSGAIVLLLVPVMVTVYHFRYSLPSLPLAGTAAGLGVTCLLGRLHRHREHDAGEYAQHEHPAIRENEPVSSAPNRT